MRADSSVFGDLVGQKAAVDEIRRAAQAAGRIIRNDTGNTSAMTHAWLFTGPPGSGRSLAARAFAAALQCSAEIPGCGQCSECKAVFAGSHPDVKIVSTDLVTICATEVREFVAQSYLAPACGNWRVFIIEDADRMLRRTTNVLLKAIEEPGPRTVWILCTAAVADVLPTIRSRCRNINLVTPSVGEVAKLLTERDGTDPQTAAVCAQAAQSHIGVARALATDAQASGIRKRTLEILVSVRGIGDAVIAAEALTNTDYMMYGKKGKTKTSLAEKVSAEKTKKMEALGLDAAGKIPAALRNQINVDSALVKRRETRAKRDLYDRELIYLESYFRDVLVCRLGSSVQLINPDFEQSIRRRAENTQIGAAIKILDELEQARARLAQNGAPATVFAAALGAVTADVNLF